MADDRIIERLDSLIEMGEKVLSSSSHSQDERFVNTGLAQQWRTSSLTFLNASLGSRSIHYREFEERCKSSWRYEAEAGLAILKAAKDDIEGGYIRKVETLVSAEVFTDFLDMAGHLLGNGYKDPAASLTGAVLEDGLRRICGNHGLAVKSDDNISSLNKKLADNEVYNRLHQREIEVWNKLRDYADHGKFDEYSAEDVKKMLEGVSNFLASQLA